MTDDLTDAKLVQALANIEEGLTERELDFVENIAKQVLDPQRPRLLSAAQRAWAERIYDRLC